MSLKSYRQLKPEEVERIRDLDRTETICVGYRMEAGSLQRMDVQWDTPPWHENGDDHSFSAKIRYVKDIIALGGILWGALEGQRLVGMTALVPRLTDTMAHLAWLHVSHGYRRQGIGSRLYADVECLAIESGASHIYVSATPSGSAVGFYTSRGFVVTPSPHPELLAAEPEDIHLVKPLQAFKSSVSQGGRVSSQQDEDVR